MTRTGKIARLPRAIREQLNRRLQDGEKGIHLVAWLNSLPEVQEVLAHDFKGCAISEQNLSEWKQGGYQDWLARQETLACARELTGDATELREAAAGSLCDHLAVVLSARYAQLLAGWNGDVNEDFQRKARALSALCQDIAELRRGDHCAERLRLDSNRFTDAQLAANERALDLLAAEIKQIPEARKAFEDLRAIVMKCESKEDRAAAGNPAESN